MCDLAHIIIYLFVEKAIGNTVFMLERVSFKYKATDLE